MTNHTRLANFARDAAREARRNDSRGRSGNSARALDESRERMSLRAKQRSEKAEKEARAELERNKKQIRDKELEELHAAMRKPRRIKGDPFSEGGRFVTINRQPQIDNNTAWEAGDA